MRMPLRIPTLRSHAALCSGQVIGHVSARAEVALTARPPSQAAPLRARSLSAPLHTSASTRRKRNRCDYKFLRNTLTSDINTAREADRRTASRAPMTVIPLQNCSVAVQQVARIAAASASVAVAKRRHSSSAQLHSNGKFGAVARGEHGGTCPPESHRLSRHPESTTQRGLV